MSSSDEEGELEQVRVQFTTHHKEFKVPDTSIALPTRLTRKGLSEVINHLLGLDTHVPFDFLIVVKNILVRQKLESHITELGLSRELAIELEFSPAIQEPQLSAENEWPDWISSVDTKRQLGTNTTSVVSGTYDGKIQISVLDSKKKSLSLVHTFAAHQSAVKSICQVGDEHLISGAKDGELHLYKLEFDGKRKTCKQQQVALFTGHIGSIEATDAVMVGEHAVVLSGGWDKAVCVWKLNLSSIDDEPVPRSKTRKSTGTLKSNACIHQTEPSVMMNEHTDNVSSLVWSGRVNSSVAFSGSWDHSIRAWDVTRECSTAHYNGNKVVTDLSYSEKMQLIASAHSDHQVRLWDTRVVGDSVVKLNLKSHTGWVSCVQWSPTNSNILVSGSHDTTLKLWDIRSTVPLHTVHAHSNKVLGLDVIADGSMVVSGGADSALKAYSF